MSPTAAPGAGNSLDMTTAATLDGSRVPLFPSADYHNFYETDDHDTMAPSPKRARPSVDAPELPRKSALRASRLLDNLGLKLGGAVETPVGPGQQTPLDVYLSEEEGVSSDADDFSDYGYDSSNEDPLSPTRRSSHEDTARVVSVVYSGKPSIVDLTLLRRRSISPNSIATRTRSSTASSAQSPVDRPCTPASSVPSPVQPARKGSLLSDVLVKKRPPFLNIDPYANGSTYSLEMAGQREEESAKAPKTPTQLLKGMSRTFSLVRKRSRPLLRAESPQPQELVRPSTSLARVGSTEEPATNTPHPPMTPVTYKDIMRAAKKNAMMMPPPESSSPTSPVSPQATGSNQKRGILSGLAARRRSIKLTGKVIG
ncbi:hypothetical protein QBC34DRAFT_220329 [Podospora aff. communis PSN243]|uniref:Uncharacterized protein n=1 Tax=Podospora aff. communis PSN243 TaxID=3040156 RepID=A0AAV9GZW2_9PEZI|nr:hypothetical protein QBC34DRAFT_220329 [Podospora aff. communis PSN243]